MSTLFPQSVLSCSGQYLSKLPCSNTPHANVIHCVCITEQAGCCKLLADVKLLHRDTRKVENKERGERDLSLKTFKHFEFQTGCECM